MDPVGVGRAFVGALDTLYLNSVELVTSLITNCPSYPEALIPLTLIAVSVSAPVRAELVETVIVVLVVNHHLL